MLFVLPIVSQASYEGLNSEVLQTFIVLLYNGEFLMLLVTQVKTTVHHLDPSTQYTPWYLDYLQ